MFTSADVIAKGSASYSSYQIGLVDMVIETTSGPKQLLSCRYSQNHEDTGQVNLSYASFISYSVPSSITSEQDFLDTCQTRLLLFGLN